MYSFPFDVLGGGSNSKQDPAIQEATGKSDPAEVMGKLREMKNNFK
jgi:hypothetical protein